MLAVVSNARVLLTPTEINKISVMDIVPKGGNGTADIKRIITGAITNHGGPVMTSNIKVWYVFYGAWTAAQQQLIKDFTTPLGRSAWWSISKQYGNKDITFGGSKVVTASKTLLTINDVWANIWNAINTGLGPAGGSETDIYVLLTDKTVDQSDSGAGKGFCSSYCGWHTYATLSTGKKIKFAWIGMPSKCLTLVGGNTCSVLTPDSSNSPNKDYDIDSVVSVLAHELTETATDPLLNAWYDASGNENADKCAWYFGTTYTGTSTNAVGVWNEQIACKRWYIQNNWGFMPSQTCYN